MASYASKFITHMPIWLHNLAISWYGKKIFRQRYGKFYWEKRKQLENKKFLNLEDLEQEQLKKLNNFLSYAAQKSPYYKKVLKDIKPLKKIDQLNLIKITTKEEFRKNLLDIYTVPDNRTAIRSFTGGTTGKSLKVLYTARDFQYRMAILDHWKVSLGVDVFGDKKATFSGREICKRSENKVFWRYNSSYNQMLYSTFHINGNENEYIQNLNKYKPDVLNGFVSALSDLSEFILRKKIKLSFKPKAIFTTSETLTNFHRTRIERAFKTKVYDQYASAEGAPFITECSNGSLHFHSDTGIIEEVIINDVQEVLVTSFNTHGTPLIRYQIGDNISFSNKYCSCKSSYPVVNSIKGRNVDFLYSMDGKKVSLSHLADVIKGLPNSIIKMQFIQDRPDQLKVLLQVDTDLFRTSHKTSLLKEVKYRFGNIKLDVQLVDEITKESSGKYRLIKNNVEK